MNDKITYTSHCAHNCAIPAWHPVSPGGVFLLVVLLAAAFYFAIVADRLRK